MERRDIEILYLEKVSPNTSVLGLSLIPIRDLLRYVVQAHYIELAIKQRVTRAEAVKILCETYSLEKGRVYCWINSRAKEFSDYMAENYPLIADNRWQR